MKILFQSIGMVLVLFLYGYFLSAEGHEHSAHEGKEETHQNALPASALPGVLEELLIPFHPKVVHFPIALFITAFGLKVLSWISKKEFFHHTAVCLYVLAALATPIVVRTGLWEDHRLHLSHPVLEQHETFALWTMWTALMSLPVLWFFYQKAVRIFRIFFVLCLVITLSLIVLTADRGGKMVYKYGVGVEQ